MTAVTSAASTAQTRVRDTATDAKWLVPLSDLRVDDEIEQAVASVVRSGWWSMGPRVAEFEREFAALTGAKHAFAVANGTAAIHLALLALDCGRRDDVLVPSLNFVAAANTITHTGARPVFCDVIGPDDLTVDPADIEAAITPQTRAILVMHYGGHACRMDEIVELAARRGLALIEDAAHAPAATLHGRGLGTIGDVGCFSFFSNKNLPTGEGGMVVTNNDELAERIRLFRSHGMTTLTWDRHRGHASTYDVVLQGFNYRLDEMRAAIGLVELGRLRERNDARGRIVERYRAALDGVSGITMPFAPRPEVVAAHHLAVIVLPQGCARHEFQAAMVERRIQTSVHYPPIHSFTAYREESQRPLPVTDALASRLVTLPLYPHMTDDAIDAVVEAVLASV
ncbi:MAG: DegT/DnrJ/EryC1/StrS family aminotransferase [Gaiellaceae bacterium]|jgi:dTDP-4-amino-4,6-dideoxygalactose transaminase